MRAILSLCALPPKKGKSLQQTEERRAAELGSFCAILSLCAPSVPPLEAALVRGSIISLEGGLKGGRSTMKAVSPVRHPGRKALPGGCCCREGGGGGGGGGGDVGLSCLAEHGSCKVGDGDPSALCLQCDMNDCYSRLRKLVPTIPPNKRVSKVEILQHVIDYILDLQMALETHPALLRQQQQQQPPPLHPPGPPRTPLTALNTDPAGAVNKQGDSILCR